jgi:hypothetical protein
MKKLLTFPFLLTTLAMWLIGLLIIPVLYIGKPEVGITMLIILISLQVFLTVMAIRSEEQQ